MEIILLQKIANLGNLGDKVNVKSGYGRNYLIPQGMAAAATEAKIKEFEVRRAELERKASELLTAAQKRADAITNLNLVIKQKAGEEGKLFGSVGTQTISEAAIAAGVEISKSEVRLPDGVIRHTGDIEINIQVHSDVIAILHLKVEAE